MKSRETHGPAKEDGSLFPGYAGAILNGLQPKPVYGGTVDPATIAHRRRRNKAARRSRRINRIAAAAITIGALGSAYAAAAPTAHADTGDDAAFLARMATDGFGSTDGSAGLLAAGHQVCLDLDAVLPENNLRGGVAESHYVAAVTGMSLDRSMTFVANAVVLLCPWNAPLPHRQGQAL